MCGILYFDFRVKNHLMNEIYLHMKFTVFPAEGWMRIWENHPIRLSPHQKPTYKFNYK